MRFITIFSRALIAAILVMAGWNILAAQNSVSINPSQDNTLYEDAAGALSNGAGDYLFSGTTSTGAIRRALLEFDVSGNVPAGASIDSVFLQLYMSKTVAGNIDMQIFPVLDSWGEGTSNAPGEEGAGAPATTGDATWIHRFYDTVFWTDPGGDFSGTASATASVNGTGFYDWGSTAQMVSDVQDWLDNPANNFGWLIKGQESVGQTAKRFDSRENPTAANRPLLTIYYSPASAVTNEDLQKPDKFALQQNYPNPFNPVTTIAFTIPTNANVTLRVTDVTGRLVATLVDGRMNAGNHEIQFDGSNLASGIYIYSLQTNGMRQIRRMLLLK